MPEQLHPRTLLAREYWNRVARMRRDANERGLVSSYYPGIKDIGYIDYLDNIDGTIPEKLLLQEILGRGVSVWYSLFIGDFPFTTDKEEKARPDFILPDYKILIEVAGEYWHSREGAWERDAQRAAWYMVMGFSVRIIPDYEILQDPLYALLKYVPELTNPQYKGEDFRFTRNYQPSAPIIALRKRFPKVQRTRMTGETKFTRFRPTGAPPPKVKRKLGPLFTGFGPAHADYVKKIEQYGQDYRNWVINDLGSWVQDVSGAEGQTVGWVWIGDTDHEGEEGYGYWKPVNFHLTQEHKELIQFYYRFRNWWKRWRL